MQQNSFGGGKKVTKKGKKIWKRSVERSLGSDDGWMDENRKKHGGRMMMDLMYPRGYGTFLQ